MTLILLYILSIPAMWGIGKLVMTLELEQEEKMEPEEDLKLLGVSIIWIIVIITLILSEITQKKNKKKNKNA